MTAQKKGGFTLVELLVVISIIAILSVIGITVFGGVQKGARDARRRADIDAISKALEVHYGKCAEENLGGGPYCAFNGTWFSSGVIPIDPKLDRSSLINSTAANQHDSHDYGYIYINLAPLGGRSAATYTVCADLEGVGSWTGKEQDHCRSNQQ